MADGFSIIVCGARRRQQGIGEFIARWLNHAGADVCAIVGTAEETVESAQLNLREKYGIECRGYTSLEAAIERHTKRITSFESIL